MPIDLSQFTDPALDQSMSGMLPQQQVPLNQQVLPPVMAQQEAAAFIPPQAPPNEAAVDDTGGADLPELIRGIIKRQKEGEERRRKLREQTPQSIMQDMAQQYYGTPATSTLGKVGQGALQLISGAFGTAPNFTKPALDRYIAQQKALTDEEGSEGKAAVAEIAGWAKNKATQAQAATGDQKTKMQWGIAVMNNTTKQNDLEQRKILDAAKIANMGAIDTLHLQQAQDLKAKAQYDTLFKSLGIPGSDPAARAEALRATGHAAEADEYLKFEDAVTKRNAAFKQLIAGASEGKTRVSTHEGDLEKTEITLPDGRTIPTYTRKPPTSIVSTTSGGGGGGSKISLDPNTVLNALNPNAPPAPQQPGAPQPIAPQLPNPAAPIMAPQQVPAQAGQPQAQTVAPGLGKTYQPVQSAWDPRLKIAGPVYPGTEKGAGDSMEAYVDLPPGTAIGGISNKISGSTKKANDAEMNFLNSLNLMRTTVQDAYEKGTYQQKFGLVNRLPDLFKAGLTNKISRSFASGKTDDIALEDTMYTTATDLGSLKLKDLSGTQVSAAEYDRVIPTMTMLTDTPKYALANSYFNQMRAAVTLRLKNMGLLAGGGTGLDWGVLQKATQGYVDTVDNRYRAVGDKKSAYDVKPFLDADRIATEIARPLLGKDAAAGGVVPVNYNGVNLKVRIPPAMPIDVKGTDRKRKGLDILEQIKKQKMAGQPQATMIPDTGDEEGLLAG